MADAIKTNGFLGRALGAGLALTAAFTPLGATAQEATAANSIEETSNQWDPELLELHQAALAARDYAESNNGIGILIHVGQDIPNEHFASADQFGQVIVALFEQRFDTEAQYFLRQNNTPATGVTYHIGEFIHGADNGTEVKLVGDAIEAMGEAAGLLKSIKQQELAQLSQPDDPQPGG